MQRHWMKKGVFKRDGHWLGCESYDTLPWSQAGFWWHWGSLFRAKRYHSVLNLSSQTPQLLFYIWKGWRGRGEGRDVRGKASSTLTGWCLLSVWKVVKLILLDSADTVITGDLSHTSLALWGIPSIPYVSHFPVVPGSLVVPPPRSVLELAWTTSGSWLCKVFPACVFINYRLVAGNWP